MKLACCAATLGALLAPAYAGPDRDPPPGLLRFRAFGSSEGLHNLVVVRIAQDGRGDLWVGTDDGVDRYDGERFTHFGFAQGLISTTIRVVGAGADGEICAGAIGLVCFDGARFARVAGVPDVAVTGIGAARGRTWIGTARGLYVRGADTRFALAPGWPVGEPVDALAVDARGVIAAGPSGVRVTDSDGARPDAWRVVPALPDHERVDDVLRDSAGALWLRTAHHLWRLGRDGAAPADLAPGLPLQHGVEGSGALIDSPEGIYVATDDGIAYRDGDRWRLIGRERGAPFSGARTLFRDRGGTLWIGANGLFQWRGRGLIERHDPGSGLPGDVAWQVGRDPQGALWAATNLCLARVIAGVWRCLPGSESRVVRSFAFPAHGGVFLGGVPAELVYIDPAGAVTNLAIAPPDSADRTILALAIGAEGDLWIATRSGLFRLRDAVPGPIERVLVPGLAPDVRVSQLVVADGELWAATAGGVATRGREGWRVLTAADGLRATSVRYLAHTRDRGWCVAYTEAIGVSCFEPRGGALARMWHLTPDAGLSSGAVYFLGEGRRGQLWIGTGDGILAVTGDRLEHFAESDGLAGDDAAATAFYADADGGVWFGLTGGLSRLHAERYDGPPAPPRARLRRGQLGGRVFHEAPGALATPHDQSGLRVELGADALVDAARLEYQVRLAPLDTAWATSAGRELTYPALVPGTYRLEVRARIAPGPWGPPTALAFAVEPAWWQTGRFAAGLGAGLLLVLFAIARWSQRAALIRRTRQLNERSIHSLRALVEHIPDLISMHDGGAVVYCNAAARRVFGFAADTRVAGLGDRIHPDDAPAVARVMAADAAGREVVELRVRDDAGGWRTCEVSGVWLEVAGARMLVVSGRDVTERHELRAQLLVSDRMASLGTLAAGIGHELNNPLAYVLGNLQLVAEALGPDDRGEIARAIADATEGAERVHKIVAGLRAFSRVEEERRAVLELGALVRAAVELTANQVRQRAELVLELGDTPAVIADAGRLTQVIINLIGNAAHAIPDGPRDEHRITVRTRRDERGRAVLEVIDTGAGMAPETLARVFDPFYTTREIGGGAGLGLSICHGIVTALGGTIELTSELGKGTTVRVALPPATPVATPVVRAPSAPLPVAPARPRVLLVDDEAPVVDMLARALGREHDVVAVSCGREALAALDAGWFDAIVSDVMMPNMSGLELLEALIARAPEQAKRLIFLSGGVFTPETRTRLDHLGTVQLEKPISTRDLRQVVMKVAMAPRA